MLNSNVSSFQNGVNKIYNQCVSQGVTPTAKTPDAIVTAITKLKTIANYNVLQFIECKTVDPSGTVRIFSGDKTYKGTFTFNCVSWAGAYNMYATITHYNSNGTTKNTILSFSGRPSGGITLNSYIVNKGEYINVSMGASGSSNGHSYVQCDSTHSLLYET